MKELTAQEKELAAKALQISFKRYSWAFDLEWHTEMLNQFQSELAKVGLAIQSVDVFDSDLATRKFGKHDETL